MCELFALSAARPQQLNDYLEEFYMHSPSHPNGWGLAVFDGDNVQIEKEPVIAIRSRYLKERLRVPIVANSCLAHIRYATIGKEEYRNCHPFTARDITGRQWTLVHNGTIFNYPPLSKYTALQNGSTDTERILMYLIDCVNGLTRAKKHSLSEGERLSLIDSLAVNLAPDNKLNFALYDGSIMYIHDNSAASLFVLQKDDAAIFSTSPLTREKWEPVPMTRLVAYQNGKCIYQGTDHRSLYEEKEDEMRLLYLAYSEL